MKIVAERPEKQNEFYRAEMEPNTLELLITRNMLICNPLRNGYGRIFLYKIFKSLANCVHHLMLKNMLDSDLLY